MSHMDEQRHTCMSHTTHIDELRQTQMNDLYANESCLTRMRHVTHE
jgi:hypothetical protein